MSKSWEHLSFFLYNTTCSISLYGERSSASRLLAGAKDTARHVR